MAGQQIQLPPLNIQAVQFTLVGDSPLIVHAWSEKAKRQMLDKQMKRATKAKVAAPKKSPAPAKRAASAEKYEQPGAPWWKQHLPS